MKNIVIALLVIFSVSANSFAKSSTVKHETAPVAKTTLDNGTSQLKIEVRDIINALGLNEAEYVKLKGAVAERNHEVAEAARMYGVTSPEFNEAVAQLDQKLDATVLNIVSKYNKQHMYLAYKQAHSAGMMAVKK